MFFSTIANVNTITPFPHPRRSSSSIETAESWIVLEVCTTLEQAAEGESFRYLRWEAFDSKRAAHVHGQKFDSLNRPRGHRAGR